MTVQQGILLITEYCERGDLYHALARQQTEHLEGELCWHRRCAGAIISVQAHFQLQPLRTSDCN